ncbi:MAG TPA: phosphoribosyltransferase family protein [Nitrospirota bacterium]|jgi:predicted phosphoribosyltransferase
MIFHDRKQAGEKLAQELAALALEDPLVLALPRGGVPVGRSAARALACAFDVIPLVKIPVPWSPEASYGVVAMDGTLVLNRPLVNRLELSERELELAAAQVLEEAKRRDRLYRQGRPFPELSGKTVVLIDDGLVSGYSMLAAFFFVKKRDPRSVIAASPVASDMARRVLAAEKGLDRIVTLAVDVEQLFSMSSYYREFQPVTDDDVMRELRSP